MRLISTGALVALVLMAVGGPGSASWNLSIYRGIFQQDAKSFGAITGRVLDAAGQPVLSAEVQALSNSASMGIIPTAHTDKDGRFALGRLPPETYRLSVSKKQDGYAPTDSAFHSAGFLNVPQVTVSEGQTISGIELRLGPRAAKLTGRVTDATTNKRISAKYVQMIFHRVDNPDFYHMAGPDIYGNFRILVPPVPFTVEVTAPGYEKKNLGVLRLRKDEVRRLNISLVPTQ